MRTLALALSLATLSFPALAQQRQPPPGKPPAAQAPAPPTSRETDRQYFERIGATFTHAWNTKNARALDAVLASDAYQVNPFGHVASGKRDVQRLIQQDLNLINDVNTRFTLTRARLASPSVAVLDFRHQYSAPLPNGVDHADLTMVAVKKADRWEVKDVRVSLPDSPPRQGVGGSGTEEEAAPILKPGADAPDTSPPPTP